MKKNVQPMQCVEKPEVFSIIQWWPPSDNRYDPEELPIKQVLGKTCLNCAGINDGDIYSREDEDGDLEYFYKIDEESSFKLEPGTYILISNFGEIRFIQEEDFHSMYNIVD